MTLGVSADRRLIYYGSANLGLQDGISVEKHSTPKNYERRVSVPINGSPENVTLDSSSFLFTTAVMMDQEASFTKSVKIDVRPTNLSLCAL